MGFFQSKEEPKKAKPQPTAHDRAVLDLKHQQDKLKVAQKRIQIVIDKENEAAKKLLLEGKRDQATLALKKKKYQQKMLQQTQDLLFNLEEMVNAVDFAQREKEIFDSLKRGRDVLQQLNNEMKVEDVEKIMDDTREAIEYQNEISELLGQELVPEDEEAIEAELAELIAFAEGTKEEDKNPDLVLPNVPDNVVKPGDLVDQEKEKQEKAKEAEAC
uniref:Charged multivesicular body protein 6 n=1 Tax=Paramoeba aestuarina TaxID=180227 RepID=A0A7S4L0N7_9EUKA|mmetsp:Transcript_29441/g.45531  ORF Transcript_29441/g.45531 Transcript_29441/m.45531 type:complete len:216 (+) Transcript_29441:75-722(+)